ncbi:DUF2194 domain-containing protein [Maribacter sp. HTCC2170]|uniref:DUF2194 domain-containing protein n=1 Tax=Maribacter sp. (strain HTCC2170 / KCCM 42371) TaxID=313603 RepID=UPI00006BD3E6|nr:DUF2194 domain-containing protein [Maribacter sp. HTCC2170]EAR02550.1 predicted membrane protein [Maribacter sp. HTCC2170]
MRNLKKGIFTGLLVILVLGCQRDIYKFSGEFSMPEVSKEPPLIEFVMDNSSYENVLEHRNLKKVADYTKIPYQSIPILNFNASFKIEPTTRVLCVTETYELNNTAIDSLLGFVAKGGTLFITKKNYDQRLGFLMGFKSEASYELDSTAMGIRFKKPIFPDMAGFSLSSDKIPHRGFKSVNFSSNVNVLASSANNKDYPLIVENRIGKGRVVLYNSIRSFNKNLRGLLFSQVLLGLEGIPYPVANTSTIFLDDYPSPLYNVYKEPIKSEMNKTMSEYVTDVWWPDMKKLAIRESIKYTAYVTFDYNTYTTPPFTFKEWDNNAFNRGDKVIQKSSWLGQDIIRSGHELGFHGYNHVSLLKSDWPEPEYIGTSLNAGIKKWKTLDFKKLPISYVPPSNYIDSLGLAELEKGMPSLKYIQSTYLGDLKEGGNREFDPEPFNDYFFDYPRITSGYYLDDVNLMTAESLYLFTGIWTHFVHPDDVFQLPIKANSATSGHFEYRNKYGLNWRSRNGKVGLFDSFKKVLEDFRKRHPMVRYPNATESSNIVRDWRYSYFTHFREDGNYIVESDFRSASSENQYWFLYVSSENQRLIDQTLNGEALEYKKSSMLNGHLYSIESREPFLKLPDLYYKGRGADRNNKQVVAKTFSDYRTYKNDRTVLMPLMQLVEHYVSNNELESATNLLEQRINEGVNLSGDQWSDFAKYMTWQKRGSEIWPILERVYQKNQSIKLSEISRRISYQTAYPLKKIRERWLKRQINWGTKDLDVLREYVDYFNVEEYKDQVARALKRLKEHHPSPKNIKKYLRHLIDYDFDSVIKELNKIKPCDEDYKEMATAISWAYAHRFRYDRALEWQECSSEIEKETVNDWLIKSDSFDKLKETDYSYYLDVILANDEKKALTEIQKYESCDNKLKLKASQIAYAYANFKLYREALSWSKCTNKIPVTTRLGWLYELKEYHRLRQLYNTHIAENPEDYEVMLLMGTLMLYEGDIKRSAQIAASLPSDVENSTLKRELNKEIMSLSFADKKEMLGKYNKIIYSGVRKDMSKSIRMAEGNSVSTNSYAINDKLEPNTISNVLSYNMYDENYNVHSVSGTQSIMYPINYDLPTSDNLRRELFGFEYGFKTTSTKKFGFNGRARIERDNESKVYYQVGAGVNRVGKSNFNSLAFDFFPVRNGPGHVLDIYRTQLASYNEFKITDDLRQIFSLESNYYSDEEIDGTLLGRIEYSIINNDGFDMSPLIEGAYTLGTVDRRDGFPYWMADKRLYGGGGLVMTLGKENGGFHFVADASIFAENNNTTFERYTGNLAFRIMDFTTIKAAYEFYTIDNFYSNVFQLGLTYNFK